MQDILAYSGVIIFYLIGFVLLVIFHYGPAFAVGYLWGRRKERDYLIKEKYLIMKPGTDATSYPPIPWHYCLPVLILMVVACALLTIVFTVASA